MAYNVKNTDTIFHETSFRSISARTWLILQVLSVKIWHLEFFVVACLQHLFNWKWLGEPLMAVVSLIKETKHSGYNPTFRFPSPPLLRKQGCFMPIFFLGCRETAGRWKTFRLPVAKNELCDTRRVAHITSWQLEQAYDQAQCIAICLVYVSMFWSWNLLYHHTCTTSKESLCTCECHHCELDDGGFGNSYFNLFWSRPRVCFFQHNH